jgi:hypothetical protein
VRDVSRSTAAVSSSDPVGFDVSTRASRALARLESLSRWSASLAALVADAAAFADKARSRASQAIAMQAAPPANTTVSERCHTLQA